MPKWSDILEYDETSPSLLRWKATLSNRRIAGSVAGTLTNHGYWRTSIGRRFYLNHRIVWEIFNGTIPENKEIDHISTDRTDNRIINLRIVDRTQNNCNSNTRTDNTSGVKGLSWSRSRSKWLARVWFRHKLVLNKYFTDKSAAVQSIKTARVDYHKAHGRY